MNTIELPKYEGFSITEPPPPVQQWQERLEKMPDDQVEKHRVLAINGLEQAGQAWSPHLNIAETILARRESSS